MAVSNPWQSTSTHLDLELLVVPRSSRVGALGIHDGRLKLGIAAPPVDGAANAEVVAWFAKALRVPKAQVAVVSGDTSRRKRLRIVGDGETLALRLREAWAKHLPP